MTQARKVALFVSVLRFFSWLPLPVNHALGAMLGIIYLLFPTRDRHVVWVNLGIAYPALSVFDRLKLMLAFFMGLGKTVTELGIIWLGKTSRVLSLVKSVQGQTAMDDALAQGKGVLLLAPHFGAWELIGLYWSSRMPMTSLYQPPEQVAAADFVRHARERTGAQLVPTDLSGVRALLSALKKNQLAGVLPDQDPGENGGVFVPFFNRPAHTMVLAGRLANKSQAPVLLTVCERLSWGRGYRLHLLPCPQAIHDADVRVSASALNQGLESCVAVKPSQYVWNYKRWRRQPDGQDPYAHF